MLNTQGANFDTTQWDGFEILFVMAGGDFPRSSATARSGLYRGTPSPDWYHLGWPNLWGQGVLKGMEGVMALTNNNTAVECSFMAPGLGTCTLTSVLTTLPCSLPPPGAVHTSGSVPFAL